ncbi:hypothetical protein PHMEG_0006786 [Phytophthora megakarya]|uniref:Uncharacterized protein n=1 Tax=Phytophthora megakarya TaxID=4795 RepID=A0A225WN03_9STRA|nr:hypothetical protein PHMEG_0006786 [Phytophthora megakarya]
MDRKKSMLDVTLLRPFIGPGVHTKTAHVDVHEWNLFMRRLRVKTGEEQGLALIPHKSDFLSCPYHALVEALAA